MEVYNVHLHAAETYSDVVTINTRSGRNLVTCTHITCTV